MADKKIPLLETISTLTETRSMKEISSFSGIKYSKLVSWSSPTNSSFQSLFILEFFKRINKTTTDALIEEYNLTETTSYEYLSSNIFPIDFMDEFEQSTIEWKRNIINYFMFTKIDLFKEQLKIIEIYLQNRKEGFSKVNRRPNPYIDNVSTSDIERLKNI